MTKAAELAKMGEVLTNSQIGGRRNIVINGAMNVAQRGTSTTGLQNTGGVFTIDRFSHRRGGTWSNFEAKHEQVDVTDSLPLSAGLNHALRVTCTTAEGSVPSSSEAVAIGHYFEKGDTHQLGVGTSSMSTSILSFYVKSSIATTFGVSITANQHSTAQVLRMPFTISSANTYQRITLTIPTYNVALDSDLDTAQGWIMHFMLDGTAASETNSVWGARVDGNVLMPKDVSTTGFSNTLNATFEITGVQLEKGNKATPFEHRSFGEELALCQRYFETGQVESAASFITSTVVLGTMFFQTTKRESPTIAYTTNFTLYVEASTPSLSSHTANNIGTTTFAPRAISSSSKNGKAAHIRSGVYTADSEL